MINQAAGEALTKGWESCELKVYTDTKGIKTIGWGFNLETNGASLTCSFVGANYIALCQGIDELTQEQADAIFDYQYGKAIGWAEADIADFDALPDLAQQVTVDMVFNLGEAGLADFRTMIADLNASPIDFNAVGDAMVKSLWYSQVGRRGVGDVAMMRSCAAVADATGITEVV